MTPLEALVLGVVQGLTEFLPISSSGHLVLVQSFMNLEESQLFFFDVMLHVGTLLAVVVFMRRDIWKLCIELASIASIGRLFRSSKDQIVDNGKNVGNVGNIIVASIPTAIIALSIKDPVESLFANPKVVGSMLMITGLILWILPRLNKNKNKSTLKIRGRDAILIGIAQGLAVTPGISRSGTTISAAMALGIQPDLAARFSFLISLPAIAGAGMLELKDINNINLALSSPIPIVIGMTSAFVMGYIALKLLFSLIRRGKFSAFAYYCWFVGILMIALAASGRL